MTQAPSLQRFRFQSPSRWGRCCICRSSMVVVKSAFQSPSRWGRCCIVSSDATVTRLSPFQSPSRWGRCCIGECGQAGASRYHVSVPFSMGTVLHLGRSSHGRRRRLAFQSPSRWGRCCIAMPHAAARDECRGFSPLLDGDGVASPTRRSAARGISSVSVPFSMGTVLHPSDRLPRRCIASCFSPLLDGDGVASRACASAASAISVSVPFSMGTVLHPARRAFDHAR